MIKLYGNLRSRATRCLWMLEETGQPYELIEKSVRADDLQTADYLKLNPNARIPTLVDGDLVLWESMAINLLSGAEIRRTDAGRPGRRRHRRPTGVFGR